MMKLLLTSSGISNASLRNALTDLLGKPIAESKALFVPTGVYPFRGGPNFAWNPIGGQAASRMCGLGWTSLGLLEPSVLPSIEKSQWLPAIEEADALLVWGGDPLFLSHWMHESGLAEVLPALQNDLVYVGVSAGSIAAAHRFVETCGAPRKCAGVPLASEEVTFSSPKGEYRTTLLTAKGMGLTEFGIIPHFENENHPDALRPNAAVWAARMDVPVYAIDDDTGVKVDGASIEVVSEGRWELFPPRR